MTHRSRVPTKHNERQHTAYERAQSNPRRHFDYDAHSCMHGLGIWPDVGDLEELTILSGLTEE